MVEKTIRAVVPGGMRTVRRRLITGIEHRADGVRKRTPVHYGHRIANLMSSSEKSHAVRFELQVSDWTRLRQPQHERPRLSFRFRIGGGGLPATLPRWLRTRFPQTDWKMPDAPRRRPEAPSQVRHTK